MILLVSILIRLVATGWSLVILRRTRDWRIGFLTLMLALMTTRQVLTLLRGPETALSTGDGLTELPGLFVSVMAFLAVFGLERMLSDERRARDAVRNKEEELRKVIDLVPHLIFAKDADGRFLFANRAANQFYGQSPGELTGKLQRDVYPDKDAVEGFLRDDREVIRSGAERFSAELDLTDAAGNRRVFQVTKKPLHLDGRCDSAVLGVAVDITELHRLSAQLRQSHKLEAIGSLAGGIAHDFNNILTAILGHCELLLENASEGDARLRSIEEIHEAAVRASAMTRQLLAFSRKQILQPRVLDVNVAVGGTRRLLERLIGENITLEQEAERDLWRVRVDPAQFEQVVLNLAINARDAMPTGGRLRLETSNCYLSADDPRIGGTVKPGPYVLLQVSDTGAGMDEPTLSRIFEPFFTTKSRSHGTGLGLSTVYGIVKQSGGYVTCRSEVGRGTSFEIYLPKAEGRLAPPELAAEASADTTGFETVLVLEDEELVRAIVCEALRGRGYEVLEAANADEAIRHCTAHAGPIQLLLTDVVLPGKSGHETARNVAALRDGIRVLYMSGYTYDAIGRHGVLSAGVNFLQKPFTPSELVVKVREVLERRP